MSPEILVVLFGLQVCDPSQSWGLRRIPARVSLNGAFHSFINCGVIRHILQPTLVWTVIKQITVEPDMADSKTTVGTLLISAMFMISIVVKASRHGIGAVAGGVPGWPVVGISLLVFSAAFYWRYRKAQ